jgi:sugar lactone lactonase YvrE
MAKMILSEPMCVAPTGDRCGEGAVWHPTERALYWTDINRFLVHRYDPVTGSVRTWIFNEPVTSVVLTDREDTLLLVSASQVLLWQPLTDTRRELGFRLTGFPAVRLNEGKADPRGSLWLGSMRNNVHADGSSSEAGGTDGVLQRVDPEGSVSQWRLEFGIQNTIAWSPDAGRIVYADTLANSIYIAEYDIATGSIGAEREFFRGFSRGLPDGSAMDADGYLWNCRFYGGCIVRIAPDGSVDTVLELPVTNITTCAFGGNDGVTLYITTASLAAPESERLAGSLFAVRTATQGLPENRFRIGKGTR